jgi:succinoglycan biosynthesis transport protein ExoP
MNYSPEHRNLNPDSKELIVRSAVPPVSPAYPYLSGVREPRSQWLEYWEALRRKLLMVGLLAALGGGAGLLAALLQHPLYRARTVLDIRNLDENLLNVRDAGAATGASATGLPESYLQTEIKILQSDSVLKRALDRMPKVQLASQQPRSLSLFNGLLRIPQPRQASLNDLVADASHRIKVRALGNTRIVEILCDGRDGQIAANMCNNLAQTYILYNLESRHESTSETGDWLKSQLESVRLRLTQSESELKDSARESTLVFNNELDNPAQDQLRQLETELSRAQGERISKQSEYEVLLTSGPDALPLSLDQGPIRDYRMRLAELNRQLAEMSTTMTPEHYKIRELKSEISQLASALQKERGDLLNRLRTDYESVQRRETMLKAAYDQQIATVSEHGDKAVRYEMLKRDVDSGRKLYEVLLQRVEEVNLANAMRASTISVVDKAVAPTVPYSPHWPASTAIGFFAGACLGLGLAVISSRSDQTLRVPGEAPSHLHIRELGVIPSARARNAWPHFRRARAAPQLNGYLELDLDRSKLEANRAMTIQICNKQDVELVTLRDDQPQVAEAFCGAMNSLLFAIVGGVRARVIVITSPEVGDGKTSVTTNLAIALARSGRRVALVDGDLRRPRLHEVFDLETQGGLATLLLDSKPIGELAETAIALPTGVEGLFVLPTAAAKGQDVSALLHSARMSALLRRLRGKFDVVLVDSPPMALLSDARVLGSLSDGVLLVFRAGKTTRESAVATQQCFREDGIPILGTVLNDWNSRKSRARAEQHLSRYAYDRT